MLREILIYSCFIIPIVIIGNAIWASKFKGKRSDIHGVIGISLVVVWISCCAAVYVTRVKEPAPVVATDWSDSAITTASQRVAGWQKDGMLNLEIGSSKAYISPELWSRIDVPEKKELMISVIIYADSERERKHSRFNFFDLTTGKQLASWSNISDFSFQY